MGKFIDLTGQKFGKWTVLKKSEIRKNNKIYWTCKCECGTIKDVCGADLKNGKNQSCGCLIKEKSSKNLINELGNRYGRLLVIDRAENDKKNEARWVCLCDCGNITITSGYLLRKGATQSCGCLHKEQLSKRTLNNLIGQRFDKLTVMYSNGRTNSKEVIWHCKCDCGNEKDVVASNLIKGKTHSCGCLQGSLGENKIKEILENYNIKYIREYTPKNLSFNGRFDFYIPSLNTLIEFDGKQHFEPIEYFGGIEEFKIRKAHDKEKNKWALENGITLIRIPYTHKDLCIEDLMPETSSFILHNIET